MLCTFDEKPNAILIVFGGVPFKDEQIHQFLLLNSHLLLNADCKYSDTNVSYSQFTCIVDEN